MPRLRRASVVIATIANCLVALAVLLTSGQALAQRVSHQCASPWPAWESFKENFISADGRVVDGITAKKQTVSEAQAYALFFALVANDRRTFDTVLQWTENNLTQGDLTSRLPAWQWGLRDDGSWGVVDANAASDADLWIVYALGEAGRLWGDPRFSNLSAAIAERMLREETAVINGLGRVLLPGPKGFQMSAHTWRLNPSYFPMQVLTWFSNQKFDPAWKDISKTSLRIVTESARRGFSPDWVLYKEGTGFVGEATERGKNTGGYDAIRVYLWAGMLSTEASERRLLLSSLSSFSNLVGRIGYIPEFIDTTSGDVMGMAPSGFYAAVQPFFLARRDAAILKKASDRLANTPVRPDAYYEQVLSMFGLGWMDKRYEFRRGGELAPQWDKACVADINKSPPSGRRR